MRNRMLVALLLTVGCAAPGSSEPTAEHGAPGVQPVRALDGRALLPAAKPPEETARLAAQTEEAWVWLGRRLSYEFRYHDAIAAFSDGLLRFPDSFRLLRHRGHRYISVREFDRAVADLTRAEALARGLPDEPEPDGAPSPASAAAGPRSTLQANISYHLGLAHYLRGEFDTGARAFAAGLPFARANDDMLVSHTWWVVLAQRRAGGRVEGLPTDAELLAPIRADLAVLENHSYHRLLLVAKGELTEAELLPAEVTDVDSATLTYGLAALRLAAGDETGGLALCHRAMTGPAWMAFGHIGSEAEVWRRRGATH